LHADGDQTEILEYIADIILELQGLAQKAGHFDLAQRLLSAYEAARINGLEERANETAA